MSALVGACWHVNGWLVLAAHPQAPICNQKPAWHLPRRLQCEDAPLNSILCSNRAHVNLLLGNFRNAYQDGLAALRHNSQNIKVGDGGADWPGACHVGTWWPGKIERAAGGSIVNACCNRYCL